MNATTNVAPIAHEVVDLLDHQGLRPGADFSIRANDFAGLDLTSDGLRVVRIAVDDGTVSVFVLEGRAQLLGARASFTWMPAGVIAAVVAAYLTA